jgi:hypothetical protein
MSKFLYRNVRGRDLLDAFLISAISSLLLLRFYLNLTGYPLIGGGPLHIAHMLYGGVLMMIALVVSFVFLGVRSRQISAIVGGVGFGIFIDELGKFITKDNDYFFRPAIGIIYAVFVVLYLLFNFLTRTQRLTSREYQINALAELEEAVAQDLDSSERAHIYRLLDASKKDSAMTRHLREFVDSLRITADVKPSHVRLLIRKIDAVYKRFWEKRSSNILVRLVFIAQAAILIAAVAYTVYKNIDDITAVLSGSLTYGRELIVAQVIASVVAGGFVLYGLSKLTSSRYDAFEQFRRATLINIYLIQFFIFVRIQFQALPGFLVSVVLLILITFVLRQERKLGQASDIS